MSGEIHQFSRNTNFFVLKCIEHFKKNWENSVYNNYVREYSKLTISGSGTNNNKTIQTRQLKQLKQQKHPSYCSYVGFTAISFVANGNILRTVKSLSAINLGDKCLIFERILKKLVKVDKQPIHQDQTVKKHLETIFFVRSAGGQLSFLEIFLDDEKD
ncbi:hypothetical protein BDC45DRAFT_537092 [Circinella umbellata]|nr:hypothetical protein BDC45DRAFT_537092 [Circinella umbellata]